MSRLASPCRRGVPARSRRERPLRRPERAWLAPRTGAEVRAAEYRRQAARRQAQGAFYLAAGATALLLASVLASIAHGVQP